MASDENEEGMELEAEHVFLLMKKEYRISRNNRAQWYFHHLNEVVNVPKAESMEHFNGEIDIVAAVPHETPNEWDWDTSHLYQYLITPSTTVTFLSHTYRLALCIDLSPSAATVDCVQGTTLLDEILTSFKNCVHGLARPFMVPGSQLLFCPKIYVTVIAHSPFLVSKGQQVLVSGWLLQQGNVTSLLDLVQQKLSSFEVRLSYWTNLVEVQRDAQLDVEEDCIVGCLFDTFAEKQAAVLSNNSTHSSSPPAVTMMLPEMAFISILRYGMLALEMLPENSSAGIIVFTDGVFGTTDAGMLEVLLTQLRHNTIGCSFVQVGSRSCNPSSSEGFLPNNDLMSFLAATTFGACLAGPVEVDLLGYEYRMNVYHQHFLTWGFHKSLFWPQSSSNTMNSMPNACFETSSLHRVQKKEIDYPVNCPLHSVLSCRLREGFTIREVLLDEEDTVEVQLSLPWRPSIQVEYTIRGQWPINQGTVRCEVSVQGPYDFLHDVTCRKVQSLHSRFRQMVVQSYWALLKNLSETDQLLAHLHSFSSNPAFYTVPDAVKNGVPLFYLSPTESSLVNTSSDFAYPQFEQFWRPVCVLDLGYWQRWLHSHQICVLLQHDRPMPKQMHIPSASGRYHAIQCRQAATALNAALRDFTTFVLLENHSYIDLVYTERDKPPVSFYLVRLTHKPPCVLIRIAFLGGTAGSIRQKIVAELKGVIESLVFPQRFLPQNLSPVAISCCKVLRKPADKILLRYEKIPSDFSQVLPSHEPLAASTSNSGTNHNNNNVKRPSTTNTGPSPLGSVVATTQWSPLSSYLYHKRWIWSIQGSPGLALSLNSVARILSIITKMRLGEGFCFAHSASGILTFLLEVDMEGDHCQPVVAVGNDQEDQRLMSSSSSNSVCVVQYVLFPPHNTTSYIVKDSVSEDEATEESDILDANDAQLEIVTECWVEPQAGVTVDLCKGLDYASLAESFYPLDLDCISSLVTFEHLNLMCRLQPSLQPVAFSSPAPPPPPLPQPPPRPASSAGRRRYDEEQRVLKDSSVTVVPFCFHLPRLLPKCSRAKLLFSTFVQEFGLPVRYGPAEADGVNELLFELLTRQLEELGHREVTLQEEDCRQLLISLELESAAAMKPDDYDNVNETEAQADAGHTPREASSTPRSPRDWTGSSASNLSTLRSTFLASSKADGSGTGHPVSSLAGSNRVPMWRCFVKSLGSTHVILVLLPASFHDLKLLKLNDERLLAPPSTQHVTRVAPDELPVDEENQEPQETGKEATDDIEEAAGTTTTSSMQSMQSISIGLTRTNSFAAQQRSPFESATSRLRAGSLDAAPLSLDGPAQQPHHHSVGSADRRYLPITRPSNPPPPQSLSSFGNTSSSPFRPIDPSPTSVFASVTMPVYVFDCPLTSLVGQLLTKGQASKEEFCRDHTFRDASADSSEATEAASARQFEPDANETSSSPSESFSTLSHYCTIVEAAYCKSLGSALFTSLQLGRLIHSRDVEAALELCRETLLEIDVTPFLDNICGHLKDFRKQAVKESRRLANSKDAGHKVESQDDPLSHFPLNLLHEHKPCAKLKHLHRLIRLRFQEILCQSFHPVPSLSDYYVYRPMIVPQPVTTEQPITGEPMAIDVSTSDVEIEFLRRRRRSQQQRGPMDREQDSMSVGFSSALSQDGRCDSVSTSGADGVVGENGESDIDDEDDEDIDLEIGEDQDVDSDDMQEEPPVPLFLHLTATVRWKKDVASQSLRSLPTCLGDLISCLSTNTDIDLNDLKITLDFLFLTFRSEAADDGLPVPGVGPRTGNLRTTSFCSSSSGMLDVLSGFVLPPATPAMQVSQSELSQDDADADIDEAGEQETAVEGEEVDRNKESPSLHHPHILHRAAESLARQLQHVPESQRRPVKAALSEIEWMLRDEIVAFLLDSCPITESILSSVVQHVHSSPHRPSCRRKTVQLNFVLNPAESFRSFLVEFKKISIQDHQLREEGVFYYLTEKETGIKRRYNSSLDPPLGSNNLLHLQRMSSNENDTYTTTQVESRSRSLVAQSSSDSHCSTTATTQIINNALVDEVLEDNVMMESSTTLVSYSADPVTCDDVEPGSPLKQSSNKRRFESGTSTSNPGRTSDSSSLVDSIRNMEDGYEGGSSGDSDDECEWLKDDPKMPPFWLVVRVKEEAVVTYFHCRHELARPDELLQWRHLHEDLLEQIEALGKRVNQQMLLQDLHDTRLCNQLLEPETNDDIWHQDEAAHVKHSPMSRYSGEGACRRSHQNSASGFILEASLKLQPGTFECPQVWEAHFPLHPRLKTGPGKLGTSKGVQQLRFVLSAFSVNNRSNMFVYQETRAENKSVFYLRLHESSTCPVGHTKMATASDNVSVSFSTSTIRCLADEADGGNLSSSRRASQWFLHSADEEVVTDGPSGGMSYKRSGSFGAASESDATSLSRFQSQTLVQQRCEDCIQLKVHGIVEAGPAIRIDLVRVLQNKLDDAVLEVLHSLLSRNPACKLTHDDVHFIQKPHEPPHSHIRFAVQPPALPYLPSLAHYVRQNLLDSVFYTPKYMGNFAGHHFQDYSANPVASTDVYLYNRPQASGNRGIACIALAVVDGRGNILLQQQSLMHWPKPSVENNSGGSDPLLEELDQFVRCSPLDPSTPTNGSGKRPGPLAMIEFRIWERGHINIDTLSEKLEAAICYALWDVVLEYRLLPYPLCSSLQSPGGPSGSTITSSMQSLPCSEPTTPVRLNDEELPADPRSRSVSFSGLPPQRSNSSAADETNKWKTRHASGTHPYSQANRPHSPISTVQLRGSTGPASPMEHHQHRACERSMSTTSVTSSLAAVAAAASLISSATTHELSQLETGERGQLHTVYSTTIERWFHRGLDRGAPAVRLQKVNVLAPLTVPLLLKAFSHICSSATADMTVKIFSCSDDNLIFLPCPTASLCPKQASPDRSILTSRYILLGRNLNQWKESLAGEMQPGQLDNSQVMALKLQRNHQRFVSFLVQQEKQQEQTEISEPSSMLLIPRQRLLWVTVDRERSEWAMWTYNFHKDSHESLAKQCVSLIQWHNARWALLSSIVAQKLGLFHNQQCIMGPGSGGRMKYAHPTLRGNPFLSMGDSETLIKMHLPPPSSREYTTSSGVDGQQRGAKASGQQQQQLPHLPHTAHLEAFRDSKPVRLLNQSPYGNQGDLVVRHGQQLIEKRHAERRDEMQRLLVLWQSRSSGSTVTVTEDVIQLFRQVARVIHYCFTPLLFLPKWRLQVARTRDPNMATLPTPPTMTDVTIKSRHESGNSMQSGRNSPVGGGSPPRQPRRPTDDHWHQSLCSAYLQEYVQYLHTLGFLQMEIKPIATKRGPKSALKSQRVPGEDERVRRVSLPTRAHLASPGNVSNTSETSSTAATATASSITTSNNNNILFFHKSHQGGIIVCEVAIQEPFFYTKVYALETSRLLMAGSGGLTHPTLAHIASAQAHYTDRFLNECDHIKVLLHLHSFTYDFHLRSLTSFVSGRQFLLKPAFHLVSFLDDFSKYYNKAPNFARNQVVVNTLSLKDVATPGEQLFDYLLNHERRYGFQVLRMVSSPADAINNDPPNTEYVLAKQWPFKALQRDSGDMKQMDDYDVTLLVAHDPPAPGDDPFKLTLKYYVVLSSKREYYPRLLVEKKPGKFRTVSTATLIKAASAPPLDSTPTSSAMSRTIAEEQQEQEPQQQINEPSPDPLSTGSQQPDAPLSVSNPEMSFIKRKESSVSLMAVPEENRTSPSSAAAVAAAAVAAAAAAVKHPAMRSPMFIRQEVINYLGYYTKHEQDMQSMINEQAAKAEELILTIVNQARVHCRRDTLWQRLQHQVTGVLSHNHYQPQMTYNEFRELLTLSHSEPVSLSEPQQLVPLLAQPVSWYQGLAKLLLSRYPETQRNFTSADGSAQYVVILNKRLPATAMMLSWDVQADRAELNTLCREVPVDSSESELHSIMDISHSRPVIMQAFVEEFINLCCFNMWTGLLG